MKIRLYVNTGFVGANHEDEVEITDEEAANMTENDFDEMAREFMHNCIEFGWKKIA